MATIGYTRVSTDDQTTENQRQQIAERYKIDKWFNDDAVSGTTAASSREQFARLVEYVRDGDTVIITALDRIGRNTLDVLQTVEALKAKGAAVVSMREGFDLSTPTGKAMLTIIAALAELELANMAERRRAGIKRAQAAGVHCGRPKIDTDAATVGALFAAGKTWQEIGELTGASKSTIYRLKRQHDATAD
ncbi:TPA: recombinase family protein [Enterobacter hormaechei subsp. steigerwaltii]|nr:recombinase family protein [Enterobacter hormaechei subsp. steigerwaltii]